MNRGKLIAATLLILAGVGFTSDSASKPKLKSNVHVLYLKPDSIIAACETGQAVAHELASGAVQVICKHSPDEEDRAGSEVR